MVDETVGHMVDSDCPDRLGLPAVDAFLVYHVVGGFDAMKNLGSQGGKVGEELGVLNSHRFLPLHQRVPGTVRHDDCRE
jgi:hypothetical protein